MKLTDVAEKPRDALYYVEMSLRIEARNICPSCLDTVHECDRRTDRQTGG